MKQITTKEKLSHKRALIDNMATMLFKDLIRPV